jgi:gliding motility-associated-like protein
MKPLLLIASLILSATLIHAQRPPVDCKKAPMFVLNDSTGASYLHTLKIDNVGGTANLEPLPNACGNYVNGIGYRLEDRMVYGCEGGNLIQIDGTGAAKTLAKLSVGFIAGDVTPDGRYLVAWTINGLFLIDLASGNYEETKIDFKLPPGMQTFITTDIAFNPVSGILYGFDAGLQALVTIDIVTGKVTPEPFVHTDISTGLPALFFDAYGNLWGIGSNYEEKHLYQLSTFTGEVLSKIPIYYNTGGKRSDGCSCPGTFNFQKTAFPNYVSHCGSLDFIFTLSNRTGATQLGISIEDQIPAGGMIEKIVKNPYGGQILSGLGTDYLFIENMTVPQGVDSLIIRVKLDNLSSGTYKNQAQLKNVILQTAMETLISDDPRTHTLLDSTAFYVENLPKTLKSKRLYVCPGASIELDATVLGAIAYRWENDASTPSIIVGRPGVYLVDIQTVCETAVDTFFVLDAGFQVEIGPDTTLQIGDTLVFHPILSGTGKYFEQHWTSNPNDVHQCAHCAYQAVYPSFKTEYSVLFSNEYGCTATDSRVLDVLRDIYVPNVFSPNGDGANEYFLIQSKNSLQIITWQIFDRWGSLVFERNHVETNDIASAWNPQVQEKELPVGVYTWIAEIGYPDGRTENLKGDVTVVR